MRRSETVSSTASRSTEADTGLCCVRCAHGDVRIARYEPSIVLAGLAMFVALALDPHAVDAAQAPAPNPVLTTEHFAFFSDFATNLNQTLVADFVARRDKRPGVFGTGADKMCFDALPSTARDGWGRASGVLPDE